MKKEHQGRVNTIIRPPLNFWPFLSLTPMSTEPKSHSAAWSAPKLESCCFFYLDHPPISACEIVHILLKYVSSVTPSQILNWN